MILPPSLPVDGGGGGVEAASRSESSRRSESLSRWQPLSVYRRRRRRRPRERNRREAAWLPNGAEAEGTEAAERDRGRERRPSLSCSHPVCLSFSPLGARVQYFSACTAAGRRAQSLITALRSPEAEHSSRRNLHLYRVSAVAAVLTTTRSRRASSSRGARARPRAGVRANHRRRTYARRACAPIGAGPQGPVAPVSTRTDPGKPRGHGARELVPNRSLPHGRYPSAVGLAWW